MSAEAWKRLELGNALRQALERDEFRLYYQPKLSMESGRIVSMEALLRWEHPERGLLEPEEFLPFAEDSGLMVPIGYWIIEEVCRQGRAWQDARSDRKPPRVGANISPTQFARTDLVETISDSLERTGLEPENLALEIDESILMDDAEASIAKLGALKELGVRVVIDEFGTAYSSLSHLQHFPPNVLKLDRSLVVKLGEGPADEAIVAAMINLAHALGWSVNAHGVETAEQLEHLKRLGCDMVQGYYFHRPITAEEATALLEADTRLI
ncbi:MAG: EAL domain-containing protein, partial [Rubrobacteraceae bacterium]|nr:EAL domain-containing protein [Rubrobacteraceae bacterium]